MSKTSDFMQSRWVKRIRFGCVIAIVLMAVSVTCVRLLTPLATQHKPELEHQLSLLLGEEVTIHKMQTSWYWFQPVLKLNDVRVYTHDKAVLTLNKLLVGVNLASSLWHWHIQPGVLFLDEVHFTLQQTKTGWSIVGIHNGNALSAVSPDSVLPIVRWLLLQQKIIIDHVSATIHLQDGTIVPVHSLTLQAAHRGGHFRVKGHASLGQGVLTELTLLADLSSVANRVTSLAGQVYLSLDRLQFAPLQALLTHFPYHLERGQGNLQLWLTLQAGQIHAAQATIALDSAWWRKPQAKTHQVIEHLSANLAWKPTRSGWEWSADHVDLTAAQHHWPTNNLSLRYHRAHDTYHLFIKNLALDHRLTRWFDWPAALESVFQLKPSGQLENSQLSFHAGQINAFLTRFSHLSWQAKESIPAVTDLSGVCYWEPHSGRLELDSEATAVAFSGHQAIQLNTLNLALDWRAYRNGWRVNVDRLLVDHPHAVISGRGLLYEASLADLGKVQIAAEISAHDAEFWLPYLPTTILKPKLAHWLTHDIRRIAQLNGHLLLSGHVADFPFDKKPGTFNLVTSLNGVDLAFHPDWPLVTNMEGALTVDKRALSADIRHADLHQGLVASHVNLNLAEIGLGRETLLVNGRVDAPAASMLAYIDVSPLKKRLAKLNALSLRKPLALDLALAIPLGPDDDEVLFHGAVHFVDNGLSIKHALTPLDIEHVTGDLVFDEQGVKSSPLQATFLEDPLQLIVRSVQQPYAATEIQLAGEFSLALMQQRWPLAAFTVLQGRLPLQGLLLFADEAQHADTFHFESSLAGVEVALPAPFGKSGEQLLPAQVDLSLQAEQGMNLAARYGESIRSQLHFAGEAQGFALQQGLICIDCGDKPTGSKLGIDVIAHLAQADWSQWQKAWVSLADASGSSNQLSAIHAVDLKLTRLALFGESLRDLHLHAVQSPENTWAIQLDHRDLIANLNYQTATNTLTGHVARFALLKPASLGQNTPVRSAIQPSQIPHLDLTCDELQWGDRTFGPLVLKSNSTADQWHLDELSIKSPPYFIQFSGDWTQRAGKNVTTLQTNLYVSNVAKFLALWSIPPVVEASTGEMQFRGGWPGDPRDFSLSTVAGELSLVVKNGRITHLDAETEKKLGVGKLLSVLSLQTIPRRLKLDFSDLSKTGYSFDRFKGQFVLKNGMMSTDNSSIDGPVAYATMKGSLNLTKQLYDLTLHVSPHVTASLPVIVTLAGGPIAGPIAGLATWMASKVINQGVDKVTGYTYKISGPWLEPVVQPVKIDRE